MRQEFRLSDFFAFLFDPGAIHGLADAFARRFLQRVLASSSDQDLSISATDPDIWDLGG